MPDRKPGAYCQICGATNNEPHHDPDAKRVMTVLKWSGADQQHQCQLCREGRKQMKAAAKRTPKPLDFPDAHTVRKLLRRVEVLLAASRSLLSEPEVERLIGTEETLRCLLNGKSHLNTWLDRHEKTYRDYQSQKAGTTR